MGSHGAFGHAWGTKTLTMTPHKVSPCTLNNGKYGRWPIMYMDNGTTLLYLALIIVTIDAHVGIRTRCLIPTFVLQA